MPTTRQSTLTTYGENAVADPVVSRVGIQIVEDFYLHMALMGKIFQVRAGTITTPLVGSVAIADTTCEFAVNALAAGLVLPVSLQISIRLATGTVHEYAAKSVAGASTGTAFVPLPMRSDGGGATATAIVQAHAGVSPAELATTTLRHWEYANPVAAGAGNDPGASSVNRWEPRDPPVLVGARTFYVQIGAATTGPSYYAHLDFIDDPTKALL